MANLDNIAKNYSSLINEVKSGQIKIPQFQRNFVWDIRSSAKLIDSIIKGYPIGTFIFWRTDEELRSVKDIGNISLPKQEKGEFVNYVLDGQQRLTSFFAAVSGEIIERADKRKEDFSNIYIDLDASIENDDELVLNDVEGKPEYSTIRLTDLLNADFTFLASYPSEYQQKLINYQNIIKGYNFNIINLKDASIDVATEVFTRLNVGGKALTLFEIMVAKTYDVNTNFDLADKYSILINELRDVKYDEVSSATLLQIVAIIAERDCTRKTILKLDKHEFIKTWDVAVSCLKDTIDYLKSYGIPVSRLLPYNAILVPFSYFFYKHKYKPTGEIKKMLDDFFWRVSLGNRYSSGVEGKIAQDINKIDQIINSSLPKYEWSIDISPQFLMHPSIGYFSTSRSYIKAILCLYAMKKPKSFDNNLDVKIDNSYLKVTTSKNYHHFFPKSWMRKNYPDKGYNEYNHILNITIVDDFLNKRQIGAKPPSVYMEKFINDNDEISDAMKTHLINQIQEFGILSNDYDMFFKSRALAVSQELSKMIISQETGNEHYEDISDFSEEEIEIEIDELME